MNAQCPHNGPPLCRLCSDSSQPRFTGGGGGLVCGLVEEVNFLSTNFDSKQSKNTLDLLVRSTFYISFEVSLPLCLDRGR